MSGCIQYPRNGFIKYVGHKQLGSFNSIYYKSMYMVFTGQENLLSVFNVSNKLYLLGGIIGAFITFTVIKSISDLGPAYATMLILLAQLVTSCLIEGFGLFGTEKMCFEWSKLIGAALMIAGIIIFKK